MAVEHLIMEIGEYGYKSETGEVPFRKRYFYIFMEKVEAIQKRNSTKSNSVGLLMKREIDTMKNGEFIN